MANFQHSKSKRFSEAWYKEVEPILEKEFASQMLPNECEVPKLTPKFVITNPEDENQTREIREFFANRIKLNHQLMENIVNSQLGVTEKLMEQLCLSDLDKRKIQELEADLDQTRRLNSDYSAKNDALNKEITSLMARIEAFGKVSRDETPKLNRERRHQSKLMPFDSNVATLCKRFNENGKPSPVFSPVGTFRGPQLIGAFNNNNGRFANELTQSELETASIGGDGATELEADSASPGSTIVAKYDDGFGASVGNRRAKANSAGGGGAPFEKKKTVTELARTFQTTPSRRSKNGGTPSRVICGGGGGGNGRYNTPRRVQNN